MPGNSDDRKYTVTYPSDKQREQWDEHADKMDVSVSEFIQQMVEAGRKKFSPRDVQPDETQLELREQRNDLKDELAHARDRIENLEQQLYTAERQQIKEFVENNPGASRSEITQHVIEKAPGRVDRHLADLEGEGEVTTNSTGYHPIEDND